MLSPEITDFLTNFEAGTHAILFYDSQESKRDLLFSHLKFGENYQGLAYVCSEENPDQIRGEMIKFGLDAKTVKGRERLIVSNYDDVYIVNGEVSIPGIIGKFSSLVDAYKSRGFTGLRAAAEMSCFIQNDKKDELVAYENALHRRFSFAAEGICAYSIAEMVRSGYLDVLMNLVRAHDPVIFASPTGYLLLRPDKIKKKDVEMIMQVQIRN
ncbi:MAG TPA: MEDS domain-containing protein [Nitrososphaerales archaeon]|nr:MEDS domain-containing protein [Nitrososphaerales archaeon]